MPTKKTAKSKKMSSDELADLIDSSIITDDNGKKIPGSESKSEKFIRLLEYRVSKVANMIGRIANLSNRTNYEFNKEQYEKAYNYILNAADLMLSAFENSNKKTEKQTFSL